MKEQLELKCESRSASATSFTEQKIKQEIATSKLQNRVEVLVANRSHKLQVRSGASEFKKKKKKKKKKIIFFFCITTRTS